MFRHPVEARNGTFDKKWREECGDYRHRYDDWIKFWFKHSQTHTRGGDDERKFADLSKAEARLHGDTERLAHHQHTGGAKQNHAHNHHNRENGDGAGVLRHHSRVNKHTYGDEEHCAEKILYRGDDMLNAFSLGGASKD